MPDVYDLASQFRAGLLKRDRRTAAAMVRAYRAAWRGIRKEADSLLAKIAAAREDGQEVNQTWLYQQGRLQALQSQIEVEIARFAEVAAGRLAGSQERVIEETLGQAIELMQAAADESSIIASFNRLPRSAFESFVGSAQNGSPLSNLFRAISPTLSQSLTDVLLTGIASGRSVSRIARDLRDAGGIGLNRALVISRTEVMRAYREAARETYRANADVLDGWVWLSALSTRTCAMCWAMHGTFHSVEERLNDHPQGRCTMLPRVKGSTAPMPPTGAELFDRLTPEQQQKILGASAYEAWRDGKLTLADVVGERDDPQWGPTRYRRSLREILGGAPKAANPATSFKASPPFKYSSAMVEIPSDIGASMIAFARVIPDEELAADGRENEPHVTIKYGIVSEDATFLHLLIEEFKVKPITAVMGKTAVFSNAEGDDILHVEVHSPDLIALNRLICDHLEVVNNYASYVPHATLAYLKPQAGAKYADNDFLAGATFTVSEIVFSDTKNNLTRIPLLAH